MADTPDLPPLSSDPAPPETSPKLSPRVPPPASQPPDSRPRSGFLAGLHGLWTLVVRLMILGAGVSLGWLAGVLVAQALPSRNLEPPLSEVALRYGSQTGRKLRQLPRWWQGGAPVSDGAGVESLPPADGAPAIESSAETSGAETSGAETSGAEPPSLTESERDRIANDLSSLQQDLASLSARVTELETSLGTAPGGTLEERLQQLDQRLSPGDQTAPADEPADSAAGEAPAPVADRVPYQEPRFVLVSDRVVLPSALLFAPGSSTLTAPGQQLLDSIVPDLARYSAATLLVGSHTDGTAPNQASQLTLQQAVAVQQHLAPQLESEGIRWVPVGYGQTRPSATGNTAADRQRNQRVEIGIVPRN